MHTQPWFMTPPIYIDFHLFYDNSRQNDYSFFHFITTLPPSPFPLSPPTHAKLRTRSCASQPRQARSRTEPIPIFNPLRAKTPADRANEHISPPRPAIQTPRRLSLGIILFSGLPPGRLVLALVLSMYSGNHRQSHARLFGPRRPENHVRRSSALHSIASGSGDVVAGAQ